MKVTVITICLNAESSIEKTIQSVLWQAYADLEYIVVDGGSGDATLDIVERYRDRITRVISEPDEGVYDAMNKGIRSSSGEIFNFMNAGDYFIAPDIVSRVVKFFQEDEEPLILYGGMILDKGGRHRCTVYPENLSLYDALWDSFCQQAFFYRRRAFADVVGFFDTSYDFCADHEWLVRAYLTNTKLLSKIPIYVCVYDGNLGLSSIHQTKVGVERKRIVDIYGAQFGRTAFLYAQWLRFWKRVSYRVRHARYR